MQIPVPTPEFPIQPAKWRNRIHIEATKPPSLGLLRGVSSYCKKPGFLIRQKRHVQLVECEREVHATYLQICHLRVQPSKKALSSAGPNARNFKSDPNSLEIDVPDASPRRGGKD